MIRWTQQDIQIVKEFPTQYGAVRKAFQAMGAETKGLSMVTRQYDSVAITEAANDATAAKLSLILSTQRDERTETLRAFTQDEYRKIVAALL